MNNSPIDVVILVIDIDIAGNNSLNRLLFIVFNLSSMTGVENENRIAFPTIARQVLKRLNDLIP